MAQTFVGKTLRRSALAGLVGAAVLGAPIHARADGDFIDNLKLELGAFGGVHLFANDLERGVNDDPGLTTPKNAGMFGLRLGFVLHPIFMLELEGALQTRDGESVVAALVRRERERDRRPCSDAVVAGPARVLA